MKDIKDAFVLLVNVFLCSIGIAILAAAMVCGLYVGYLVVAGVFTLFR